MSSIGVVLYLYIILCCYRMVRWIVAPSPVTVTQIVSIRAAVHSVTPVTSVNTRVCPSPTTVVTRGHISVTSVSVWSVNNSMSYVLAAPLMSMKLKVWPFALNLCLNTSTYSLIFSLSEWWDRLLAHEVSSFDLRHHHWGGWRLLPSLCWRWPLSIWAWG